MNRDIHFQPLVSIIVITYNSITYVIETLESAYIQSYKNIELIISDDSSKDGTILICKKWLSNHKDRFVSSQVLEVDRNAGISANCNRGLKAAKGKWIKFIAGDDILHPECIQLNIDYITQNSQISILQTQSAFYKDTFTKENYLGTEPSVTNLNFFNLQGYDQYQLLKKKNLIVAPSIFIKKAVLIKQGGFDEYFRLFEDISMWLSLTKRNYKFFFLKQETVNYRIHGASVARSGKANISSDFAREQLKFLKKYYYEDRFMFSTITLKLKFRLLILYDKIGLNNNSTFSKYLYMITWKLLT